MIQTASHRLTEMMNQAIAAELQTIIQYMWHQVMIRGMDASELAAIFEKAAMDEMRHAEQIAERLRYFNVSPTIKPNSVSVGGSATQMLEADARAEEEAIMLYKTIIRQAASEGDETTRRLFEKILSIEEGHHDKLTTLLG